MTHARRTGDSTDELTRDELVALVARLRDANAEAAATIAELRQRIAELENKTGLDSTNSGMPPSRDDKAARTKRAQAAKEKNARKKIKRKPGKQPGASGHTLRRVEDPDLVVTHRASVCGGCGDPLEGAVVVDRKSGQVFDLPDVSVHVTEHVAETVRCGCSEITEAALPSKVRSNACWGPRMRAVCVYFVVAQHIPYDRTAEICSELLRCPISEGTIVAVVAEIAAGLVAVEATIKALLMAAGAVHFDETGARVHNGGDSHHVHVASTMLLTLLIVHKNRGRQAMDDIGILPGYTGTAVHDGYERYWDYTDCTHAKCGAHLLRNLDAIGEIDGQTVWTEPMAALLKEANTLAHKARRLGDEALAGSVVHSVKVRYGKIIAAGYRANPPPGEGHERTRAGKDAVNLLARMDRRRGDVLRYIDDLSVPFTNNIAESDLRPTKLHQKISNVWRTKTQADNWLRIRSYISTLRKNHQPVLANLQAVIDGGNPWTPASA